MNPVVKEEFKVQDIDTLQCLDGFNIVLGQNLDIIYVSENVSDFIGLTQVRITVMLIFRGHNLHALCTWGCLPWVHF